MSDRASGDEAPVRGGTGEARQPRELALVMSGGGARAAYQVGVLLAMARRMPDMLVEILTGVSAGAINAAFLAANRGTFTERVEALARTWCELEMEAVFRVDAPSLLDHVLRWGARLVSGGGAMAPRVRGLVDTAPLAALLSRSLPTGEDGTLIGVEENLANGSLRAAAVSAVSWSTGQSVTWVQGRGIEVWDRPMRKSLRCALRVDHVMASAALPLFFPAIRVEDQWYGDGGVRLAAPLSPALHLGAARMLAISTRRARSFAEADQPVIEGYPPPAQVIGVLMNSVFLDLVDQDAWRLERVNRLLDQLPEEQRDGMRRVHLLVLRPSTDLGKLANEFEPRMPRAFRFLTRGLGTRETRSNDLLSLIMFQGDYLEALIRLGESDANARMAEIEAFVAPPVA